jgi:transitional endoplasmic reticulum ATPase
MIDPALLRPGRFDKIISIPLPDKDGRKKVLEIHSKDIPLADANGPDKIDFDKLAELTDGLSSADVAAIANTAVSLVVHEHLDNAAPGKNLSDDETKKIVDAIEKKAADAKVTMKHYEEAVRKVREQKDLKMNDKLVASYYR